MIIKLTAELRGPLASSTPETLMARFGLQSGGRVQQTIDKAVIDFCLPYCPWDSGALAKSAYAATQIGSGRVRYPGPYAHYLYHGEVYGPNIPVFEDDSGIPTRFFSRPGQKKQPTGRDLQYNTDTNPLAGSFWFERMKADHKQDILQEAANVAGNKQR